MKRRAPFAPPSAFEGAYLRLNRTTREADVVCGSQVEYVLTNIHEDIDVRPQVGGGYIVTADDWSVLQYTPLAARQDMRRLSDLYKHWSSPDGKLFHEMEPMSGKALQVLVRRQPGRFYVTGLGEIARLFGGRIRDQYKPLPDGCAAA